MSEKTYSQAASAYGSAASATDQRALEGHVLLKSAQRLEELANRLKGGEKVDFREVGDILDHNRKLWTLFLSDATDPASPLPQEIKNNIATLAGYIFNRTINVMADVDTQPEKLQVLISINRNIAAGLMKKAATPPPAPGPLAAQEQKPVKTATDNLI